MKKNVYDVSFTLDEITNLIAACDYYFERVKQVFQEEFPNDEVPDYDDFIIIQACKKLQKVHEIIGAINDKK